MKLKSSGVPSMAVAELEKFLEQISERDGIQLSPEEFSDNPGLRQIAKLMLNNLWGRFGMRENMCQKKMCTDLEEVVNLLNNKEISVENIVIVSDSVVQVSFIKVSDDFLICTNNTNVFIAAVCTVTPILSFILPQTNLKRIFHVGIFLVIFQMRSNLGIR
jgi:hypothetical protein